MLSHLLQTCGNENRHLQPGVGFPTLDHLDTLVVRACVCTRNRLLRLNQRAICKRWARGTIQTPNQPAAELLASGNPHEGWKGVRWGGGGGGGRWRLVSQRLVSKCQGVANHGGLIGSDSIRWEHLLPSRLAEACQQVSRCGELQGSDRV